MLISVCCGKSPLQSWKNICRTVRLVWGVTDGPWTVTSDIRFLLLHNVQCSSYPSPYSVVKTHTHDRKRCQTFFYRGACFAEIGHNPLPLIYSLIPSLSIWENEELGQRPLCLFRMEHRSMRSRLNVQRSASTDDEMLLFCSLGVSKWARVRKGERLPGPALLPHSQSDSFSKEFDCSL